MRRVIKLTLSLLICFSVLCCRTTKLNVSTDNISGYMMNQFLELDSADGIPYRCPMLPLKGDSTPLYAAASGTETVEELPALTKAEVFCILGKAGDRWHVKVYTDEVGVWIFGFVDTGALKGSRPTCPSIDATISKTTPLYGTGEGEDPKIKKGKKVRISAFYTARPDLEDAMPLDYDRDGVAWVGVTAFIKGDYGFDEPYYGYVPVDALKYDKKLKLPANMGVK